MSPANGFVFLDVIPNYGCVLQISHLLISKVEGDGDEMCPTWQGLLFTSGKSNPYCEVTMGSQCHITKTIQDTLNPKWNSNCQFFIRDLEQEVLCITVFERDQFSPDGECTVALRAPLRAPLVLPHRLSGVRVSLPSTPWDFLRDQGGVV